MLEIKRLPKQMAMAVLLVNNDSLIDYFLELSLYVPELTCNLVSKKSCQRGIDQDSSLTSFPFQYVI